MKATTYRITMSNRRKCEIEAHSAASAIEEALRRYRGATVKECYSGLKQADVENLRLVNSTLKPIAGFINHDIPPHEAIPETTTFLPAKRLDRTAALFDDAVIAAESMRALGKASIRVLA